MTLSILVRARDGIAVATDERASHPHIADDTGTPRDHPFLVTTRTAGDHAYLLATGPRALLADFEELLGPRARETPDVVGGAVAAARRRAVERLHAAEGDPLDARRVPALRAAIGHMTPDGPRVHYVSENGAVEDHTEAGYITLGAAEVYAHTHIRHFPLAAISLPGAALVAYCIIRDAIDTGLFPLDRPIHVHALDADGPRHLDETQMAALETRRADLRAAVRAAIDDAPPAHVTARAPPVSELTP